MWRNGRRTRFRFWRGNPWRFKSSHPYQEISEMEFFNSRMTSAMTLPLRAAEAAHRKAAGMMSFTAPVAQLDRAHGYEP